MPAGRVCPHPDRTASLSARLGRPLRLMILIVCRLIVIPVHSVGMCHALMLESFRPPSVERFASCEQERG